MFTLQDKSIIVTGAAGGIGRAAAILFASLGAKVTAVDILGEQVEAVAARIRQDGGQAIGLQIDLTVEDQVAAMVDRAVKEYGRLDGAFNNAGVEQHGGELHELSLETWRHVNSCNLDAVFLCMKHEIKAMLQTGGGSIVNTSSALGTIAIPLASAYIASKHGVVGVTKAAAAEYGRRGIRVNALLPGDVASPMHDRGQDDPVMAARQEALRNARPMGRVAQPEELANSAAWMLSDANSFMTGAAVAVDGGLIAV